MRFHLSRIAAWLLLGFPAAWGQADLCRIAGVVINSSTGRPAPRIRVGLALTTARDRETVAITGEDGRFRFEGLKAGKYHLTADHPTGGRQVFGEKEGVSGFGIAIVAGPGLETGNLVFRIFPPSGIQGRIIDESGDPIEEVLVQLFVSVVVRGRRDVFYFQSRRTNDLGEYRFGPLRAGTYYLLATSRPWYTNRLRGAQSDLPMALTTYLPTFYPNTRDARAAAPLRVKPGEDLRADLAMVALPAGKLTVNIKAGEPAAEPINAPPTGLRTRPARVGALPTRVDMTFEGPGGSVGWERVENAYGDAELTGIPPGKYTVRVSTSDPANPLFGRENVTVGGSQTTLQISLGNPPVVAGKLRLEGSDTAIPRGAVIELENETENRHIRRPVGEDGSFSFENIPPGQYTPLLLSPSAMIRLRSVAVNGAASKDLWVDVTRSVRLDVTAVTKAGQVTGFAYHNDVPQAGVLVMLVPRQESSNPYDYLAFETDSDGSFDFTGVTAGDYIIFATDDFAEFEYANPVAVRPHLASGRPLRVEQGQVQTVRVELQP